MKKTFRQYTIALGLWAVASIAFAGGFMGRPSGGGLSNVVEDTTPQLGGQLDMNGQTVTGDISTDGEVAVATGGNVALSGAGGTTYVDYLSGVVRIVRGGTERLTISSAQTTLKGATYIGSEDQHLFTAGFARYILQGQSGTVNLTGPTSESAVGCATTTAAATVNLPNAPVDGTTYWIYDEDANAATNNITINRGGATDTIGTAAATSLTISTNSQGRELVYDATGANWLVTERDLL